MSVEELTDLFNAPTYEHDKGYRLIFMDDDVTPFVYVMALITALFQKDKDTAFRMTQQIHESGSSEVFKGSWEECKTKKDIVDLLNEQNNEHLFSIIEKID